MCVRTCAHEPAGVGLFHVSCVVSVFGSRVGLVCLFQKFSLFLLIFVVSL